jgi:hypothetical protein
MKRVVRLESCRGSHVPGKVILVILVGLLVGWLASAQPAAAGELEKRDFAIIVDGKPVGEYHTVIQVADDGTITLQAQSDARVTVLAVPVYTYSYKAQEVWKNGRLLHFESSGKEDSRTFAVTADVDGDMLRVTANGKSSQVPGDVLLTSCWQLPVPALRNGQVPMLGCDNGFVSTGEVQFIANEKITVAGQEQVCAHYRIVKNKIAHEYWYDGQERVVRDEWLPQGSHRTVLELTNIGR